MNRPECIFRLMLIDYVFTLIIISNIKYRTNKISVISVPILMIFYCELLSLVYFLRKGLSILYDIHAATFRRYKTLHRHPLSSRFRLTSVHRSYDLRLCWSLVTNEPLTAIGYDRQPLKYKHAKTYHYHCFHHTSSPGWMKYHAERH
jgi:hypothetical protein